MCDFSILQAVFKQISSRKHKVFAQNKMQKVLIAFLFLSIAVLSSCQALSADFKVIGHFGNNFGSRKTYYFNQKDKVVHQINERSDDNLY